MPAPATAPDTRQLKVLKDAKISDACGPLGFCNPNEPNTFRITDKLIVGCLGRGRIVGPFVEPFGGLSDLEQHEADHEVVDPLEEQQPHGAEQRVFD